MQLHSEVDLQASSTGAAPPSYRKRTSTANRKVTIRLTEKVHEQLQAATERPGVRKSMVVQSALETFLNPRPPAEDPVHHDFAELNAKFDSLERGLSVIAETVALHARYHLAVMPPLPQPQQRAACLLGDERFKVLAEQVDRRVRLGRPLIQETIDRLNLSGFPDLQAETGESGSARSTPVRANAASECEPREHRSACVREEDSGGSKIVSTGADDDEKSEQIPKHKHSARDPAPSGKLEALQERDRSTLRLIHPFSFLLLQVTISHIYFERLTRRSHLPWRPNTVSMPLRWGCLHRSISWSLGLLRYQ
jgi:hypothetical protein